MYELWTQTFYGKWCDTGPTICLIFAAISHIVQFPDQDVGLKNDLTP